MFDLIPRVPVSAFLRLIKSITEFQIKHLGGAGHLKLARLPAVSHRQPTINTCRPAISETLTSETSGRSPRPTLRNLNAWAVDA